jgi:hypothetical protein
MNTCPVCTKTALIDEPEWGGGRFFVDCGSCGRFFTNRIVIKELQRLREERSSRIDEIQQTLHRYDVPRYLNWHQSLKTIFFDYETPRTLTKSEKRGRVRSIQRGASVVVGRIYKSQDGRERNT